MQTVDVTHILSISTLSETNLGCYRSAVQVISKHRGKGEIARKEQFLFFPQGFLPIWRNFCRFDQIRNCRLQSLLGWKRLNIVILETVNLLLTLNTMFSCLNGN